MYCIWQSIFHLNRGADDKKWYQRYRSQEAWKPQFNYSRH